MHEAKIAKYVYDIVDEAVKSDKSTTDKKLLEIQFDIGVPYSVYPDSFEFYFTELVKTTPYQGVVLTFKESGNSGAFFVNSLIFED